MIETIIAAAVLSFGCSAIGKLKRKLGYKPWYLRVAEQKRMLAAIKARQEKGNK